MKAEETNESTAEIEAGQWYYLTGKIENGYRTVNGERIPNITDEQVTRMVTRVTQDKVYCECGRVFLREGLTAVRQNW